MTGIFTVDLEKPLKQAKLNYGGGGGICFGLIVFYPRYR